MEVFRALAVLLDPPVPAHAPIADALGIGSIAPLAEHTDVLVFQAYPFASVYLGAEGMLGGEARDRVAGLLRALGAEPGADVDHLGTLLATLAQLAELERTNASSAAYRRARHALFWEHVASWMPPYLALLDRVGSGFYRSWARIAELAVVSEAEELGAPTRQAMHLDGAAAAGAPADLDALIGALLAPIRVGFTIVRDDLLRAASELGLGCRAGERRFALRSLFSQDAAAVLRWFGDEGRRQAAAYDRSPLTAVAPWWSARARAAAVWLDEQAAEADGARASVA
jgi:hypothetical protein